MKKILILLCCLPFIAKAQIPVLNSDTTYTDKGHKTGVLVVTDAAYFVKLANADTLVFAQFDIFGKLTFRRISSTYTDTQFIRRDINLNTSNIATNTNNIATNSANIATNSTNITTNTNNIAANSAAIATKLNISDTAGIRIQPRAGTNITITGTFPVLTFNAILPNAPVYQVTAVPFANASGILTSDSTKLNYSGEYLSIATTSATGISGILMNQGRTEINGQFSGMYFNVGSGKTGGGTYDASKGYIFQNRGNTMFQISTSAITGGVNTAAFNANVTATGTITSTQPIKAGGYTFATLPAGAVGQFTYITDAPSASPVYLSTVTVGGGTAVVPVFRNATVWVYH